MTSPTVSLPARPPLTRILNGWLGSIIAIGLIAYLARFSHAPLMLGSFGASCVLVFGFPDLPFSQPRNVLVGHVLSSAIGLATMALLGPGPIGMAVATATAVAAMMALRCVHPPAGSNPVIIFLTQPSWSFLLLPTAMGALALLVVALIFNNQGRSRRYPQYW